MRIVFSQTAESKGSHIQRPIINNRKSLSPLPRESSFFWYQESRDRGEMECAWQKSACLNLISAVRPPALNHLKQELPYNLEVPMKRTL